MTDLSGKPPLSTIQRKQVMQTIQTFKIVLGFETIRKSKEKKNSPGAICILHPDSCCKRDICSPPLPMTKGREKVHYVQKLSKNTFSERSVV